jgi:hypothetical protein
LESDEESAHSSDLEDQKAIEENQVEKQEANQSQN